MSKPLPNFKLGQKKVYLPNFVLTLIRTPNLPPTFASFIVPLNLNKFDIRDYLYNVYDVRVKGVRSYIQQRKVQQDKPNAVMPRPRRWYRPRSLKLMTVELERPFVWPEQPEDFKDWDKKTYDAAQEYNQKNQEKFDPRASKEAPNPELETIAEQAKRILKGKDSWKPRNDLPDRSIAWPKNDRERIINDGEPVEVETDIDISKE